MLSSQEIWKLWHSFWESKNHIHLTPASLIADKNSTALFTVAGMQQLIPYLSGQEHPSWKRLHDIQHCIRTNDLEEVWDNSHNTMFFMMGNRSLGDYFKKEAIARSREFLTQHLKLDPRKLAVTAYEGDEIVPADLETVELWKSQGISSDKISLLTADDNRWSPGPVWPCGPCTEIYYWVWETEFPWLDDNVKADDSKWLEIWNNVFMEFYRDESWQLSKLDKQNVDTGMGFERINKVLQNKLSLYETDLFAPIIQIIEKITSQTYVLFDTSNPSEEEKKIAIHMRIIADHMRASSFLIAEWLLPSNEWRWYVLRRIMRRLYFHLNELLWDKADFKETIKACGIIIDTIISHYESRCPHLNKKNDVIKKSFDQELTQFAKTLNQGQKIVQKIIDESSENKILAGKDIFMLYDTFGFPVELTREIATKQWINLDDEWFEKAMEEAKEKSRANTAKINTKDIDRSIHIAWIEPTEFIGYTTYESDDIKLLKRMSFDWYDVVIFDKTPCYATMWWQLHDNGIWTDDDGQIYNIFDVQNYNWIFLHFIK
jgi:alanyl-tRNA synthetase